MRPGATSAVLRWRVGAWLVGAGLLLFVVDLIFLHNGFGFWCLCLFLMIIGTLVANPLRIMGRLREGGPADPVRAPAAARHHRLHRDDGAVPGAVRDRRVAAEHGRRAVRAPLGPPRHRPGRDAAAGRRGDPRRAPARAVARRGRLRGHLLRRAGSEPPASPAGGGSRVADPADRLADRDGLPGRPPRAPRRPPARGAAISFSIFIASTITSTCPASTASPSATSTCSTVPCIGLVTALAGGPPAPPWHAARRAGGAPRRAARVGRRVDATSKRRRRPRPRSVRCSARRPRRARRGPRGVERRGELALDQPGARLAGDELRVLQDQPVQRDRASRTPSTTNSSSARSMRAARRSRSRSQTHQLGDHRVVQRRRSRRPPRCAESTRTPGPGRLAVAHDPARRGQEAARRILGVDAALDRVAAQLDVVLARTTAARPAATAICSRTRSMPVTISVMVCSTWMRVFISRKKNVAAAVEQALDGAGADVADGARGGDGHRAHARPQLGRDGGRRRLLEDLLVAALQRAVALAEVDRPCRARRPAPAPRRAAGRPGTSRRRPPRRAKYAWPSRCAASSARSASSGVATTSSPLPPPPAAALIAIGQPYCSPSSITRRRRRSTRSVVPGTIGTPAAASMRAARRSWSPSPRSPRAAGRSRRGPPPRRRGRRPRSRPGSRSPGWIASAPRLRGGRRTRAPTCR